MNGMQARMPNLLRWLADRQPDVVGLQELKTSKRLPLRRFEDVGYYVAVDDNVALLSLRPIQDIAQPTADGRTVAGTIDGIRIVNTYAPNGFRAKTPRHDKKIEWLVDFAHVVTSQNAIADHLLLMGDFNVARHPMDVWAPENYRGRNLFTDAERTAFESVIANNALVDVLRDHHDGPGLYTWFNYAHQAFTRNRGWRLDYIFSDVELAARVEYAIVDVEERAREKTSDHAPIWIDLG